MEASFQSRDTLIMYKYLYVIKTIIHVVVERITYNQTLPLIGCKCQCVHWRSTTVLILIYLLCRGHRVSIESSSIFVVHDVGGASESKTAEENIHGTNF